MRFLFLILCFTVVGCAAEPVAVSTRGAWAPGPVAGYTPAAEHESGGPAGSGNRTASALPPLTPEAIASCPVTLPNDRSPDGNLSFNLGNDNGTIFTIPWPNGAVIFTPNGPGSQEADGSLGMKWPWYRTVRGEVVITARRLDAQTPAPDPVMLRGPEDGYGPTGFHPSGLIFSSEGCWEVTAAVAAESLTFVALAVRLPFDLPHFSWWPQDLERPTEVDLGGYPIFVRELALKPPGGQLIVETTHGQVDVQAPDRSEEEVVLQSPHDGPVICILGAPDDGKWRRRADQASLQWSLGDVTYRIIAAGLEFGCRDLLNIADSQL